MCLNVLVGLQGEVCVCVFVGKKNIILLKAAFPAEMSDTYSVVFSVQTDTESVSQLHLVQLWALSGSDELNWSQTGCQMVDKRCVQGPWVFWGRWDFLIGLAISSWALAQISGPESNHVQMFVWVFCHLALRFKLWDVWSHCPLEPTELQTGNPSAPAPLSNLQSFSQSNPRDTLQIQTSLTTCFCS